MEVACCDADQEGVWEGEWEECEVVADHGDTCDVRIVEDGEVCFGVQRRMVRAMEAQAEAEAEAEAEAVQVQPRRKRAAAAAVASASVAAPPPSGLRMEVACCDGEWDDGEWDGEWEECEVVAVRGAMCDVRILSDGEVCKGVRRRMVRAMEAEAEAEAEAEGGAAALTPEAEADAAVPEESLPLLHQLFDPLQGAAAADSALCSWLLALLHPS